MAVCAWAANTPLELAYHDQEWGRPRTDDRVLFEFLILEGAQAGLSWRTVLEKRDGYRRYFCDFDPQQVAAMGGEQVEAMLADADVIRHRGKLESAISNARVFLDIAQKHGSFAHFAWQFVDGRPIQNRWRSMAELRAETAESQQLKRLGMKFVGPTICYAYMQAVGMVNDHLLDCPCHDACRQEAERFSL